MALANAAERELQQLLPKHAAIQALLVHSVSKILHLATAWSIAHQVPLPGERLHVTEADVNAVLPLYKRVLLAWTTRGVTETFDAEQITEIVGVLREAARSLGRKHRLDPLLGLRVLQSAPFGLSVTEWATRVGASDKTIRDAWLRLLFEPRRLVERASTRYRITPLGRAVLAAAEPDPNGGGNGGNSGNGGLLGGEMTVGDSRITGTVEPESDGDGPSEAHVADEATMPAVVQAASAGNPEIAEILEIPTARPTNKRSPLIPPGISIADFEPMPEDGTLRRMKVIWDDREKDHALGETGGFLEGYTHSVNPAIGCVFACTWCGEYCYAQWEAPARLVAHALGLRWGEYIFVKKRAAEALQRDLARASDRNPDHQHHVSKLKIFMSSLTEPCAGPALAVTRECLRVFARYPIGRLVLQTRSPKVVELLPELSALGSRVLVSFTVESDSDEIWQGVSPPMLPRLRDRRKAVATLHASGVTTSVTVSPCARLADPEEFAVWIAMNASYAVVDTFVAGDGKGGTRTEKTEVPSHFAARGWTWSDETAGRALYEKVRALIGERVGWSKEGFNRLTTAPTGVR